MATDTERLVVALEARIRDFERNMDKASGTASRNFGQMERRSKEAGRRMEEHLAGSSSRITASLATLGKGALGGLLGAATIAGVNALVGRLSDITREVANIGSEAQRAGLSSKAFQELGFVARQNRIEIDALTDGLKEMSLRADEFILTGAGSAAEAFQRLGYGASELKTKLKEPSDLFVEIIGRMERLDRASQIRVADEIFGGTGGEKFVQLLDKGADGINELKKQANDLGLIMSDELIAKADELDRKFSAITETVSTGLKRAVVEVVDAMDQFFDQFRELNAQADATIKQSLSGVYADRQRVLDQIADLEIEKASSPAPNVVESQITVARAELAKLTAEAMKLRDVLDRRQGFSETFVYAGDTAKDAQPKVQSLSNSVSGMAGAGSAGAKGLTSFADAIRSLKDEIPGLTDQLADLDARTRIETAYRAALSKATSIGDTLVAEKLRNDALSALSSKGAREAGSKGMLDLIGYAEGTDKGRGYNETLGFGKFTGGDRNLVTMSIDDVLAMQKQMLAHPGNDMNSSAVGRYQIVSKTLRGLKGSLGLSGSEMFDPAMQDRLANELLRQRGNDPAGLRNEWEGLRKVDSSTIRNAYDGTSVQMPAVDPGLQATKDANAQKAKDQVQAYAEIIAQSKQFVAEQGTEQQALGMTSEAASKLRYEQQLLNEAQQAGIVLTPQQRAQISDLAGQMANAETSVNAFAQSQRDAQQIAAEWNNFAAGTLKGFVSDLVQGKSAGEAFAGVLNKIADKLLDMAINSLFENAFPTGGGKGGGGIGGILGTIGKVLGLASGGHVSGPGTGTSDSIPARLSDGEFVVNARATKQNRELLEAINRGGVPAFAGGGAVGSASFIGGASTQSVSYNSTINVTTEGSSGNRQMDREKAQATAEAIQGAVRAEIATMLQNEMRDGGSLSRRNLIV